MSLRPFVLILALMCGVGSSLLVGCGSDNSSKLIAASDSNKLVQHLQAVQNAVDLGKCPQADTALQQLSTDLGSLPASVDTSLKKELLDGYTKLSKQANTECHQVASSTVTTQATTAATTTADTTPTTTADTTPTVPDTTAPTTPTTPTTTADNGGVAPEPTTAATTPPAGVTSP